MTRYDVELYSEPSGYYRAYNIDNCFERCRINGAHKTFGRDVHGLDSFLSLLLGCAVLVLLRWGGSMAVS